MRHVDLFLLDDLFDDLPRVIGREHRAIENVEGTDSNAGRCALDVLAFAAYVIKKGDVVSALAESRDHLMRVRDHAVRARGSDVS